MEVALLLRASVRSWVVWVGGWQGTTKMCVWVAGHDAVGGIAARFGMDPLKTRTGENGDVRCRGGGVLRLAIHTETLGASL